ncbi:FAD/NAD(P)-binding domain-containing protein [Xylariaceae sp. FL0255]|nr:FAD/NAD(P)-binding domain-containing protein [Xylariaceae sp. FL0255]
MKVVIIGAGIGGLTAAIALKKAGHDVDIYESSGFLNEIGAAVGLGPNATRVLQRLGCDMKQLHAVERTGMRYYVNGKLETFQGIENRTEPKPANAQPSDMLMAHRVDLHHELQRFARETGVNIHLRSRTASVDAKAGEAHLVDGTVIKGDVIIGADGLHSRAVEAVVPNGGDIVDMGLNCFRFLVPTEKAKSNPIVAEYLEGAESSIIIDALPDRRFLFYPCRDGTLLNCAAFYPSAEPDEKTEGESWNNEGDVRRLLGHFQGCCPAVKEICKMAEDLKMYSLETRDPPKTFVRGKLAVLGDAAHPMLPHRGQGAGQAIEDAGALGEIFSGPDATPENVGKLLDLYNRVRYEHSVTAALLSRFYFATHSEETKALFKQFLPDTQIPENEFAFLWKSDPIKDVQRLRAEGVAAA